MMDLFLGKMSEMFRQFGISDDPPAATNMVDGSLDQERAMFMATHPPETIMDYGADNGYATANQTNHWRYGNTIGTWKCQAKFCAQSANLLKCHL
jgi:hypothetical protein